MPWLPFVIIALSPLIVIGAIWLYSVWSVSQFYFGSP